MQTPHSMDASDSGQEREPAPNPSLDLSPTSRGRQRKKNPKFLDYEVSEVYDGQTPQTKRSRRAAASPRVRANAATDEKDEEEEEGGEPEEAPKKGRKRRGRKPWGKKAVGKTSEAGGQDGAADVETPRPKRKYTKRKKVEELQREQAEEKNDDGDEEEQGDWETTGARPKRGAARAALKYLHSLAKDELRQPDDRKNEANGDCEAPVQKEPAWKTPHTRRGYKRKRAGEEDEEFVPNAEDDAEEKEEAHLEEDEEGAPDRKPPPKYSKNWTGGFRSDGPPTATLQAIQVSAQTNRDYRQKYHSSWVFPDWIPSSSDWQLLPHSEAERYLPEEQRSVAFSVSREGLKKEAPLRLGRFCSVPWHPDRWDSLFFCGGPVWSLEWCPAPDAALEASQFVALSCHRDMDETHRANQLYDGAGLVQIWELGALQSDKRPDSQPALVYSVAQDRGFVWGLKWCPSGAWEPPDSVRQVNVYPLVFELRGNLLVLTCEV
uniref:General transcription factor 3C polypeptide 2 n=1 Tax=Neogobius melanostomus TaxID=47308 RepID=A0A8C6SAT2_9GOBI